MCRKSRCLASFQQIIVLDFAEKFLIDFTENAEGWVKENDRET